MASAKSGRAASGFVVIAFSLAGFRGFFSFLVEERFGNHVFFRSPVSQVHQPAALAAKREIRIDRGIHRLAANGAMVLHRMNRNRYGLDSSPIDIRLKEGRYARMRSGVAVEICRAGCIGSGAAE